MHYLIAVAVLLLATCSQAVSFPKGHLVIIGGGTNTPSIRRTMVDLAGGTNAVLLAITTAGSGDGSKAGTSFVKTYSAMGAAAVKWAQPTREQSDDPKYVDDLLKGVTGVFFTGGSQRRIIAAHRDTLFHRRLLEMYANGAMIGGSSAGAAMMSSPMITGVIKNEPEVLDKDGSPAPVVFRSIAKDKVETIAGMGFIRNAIIDQHFVKRGRENRLFSVALEHPEYTCFGIDESTAIVVSRGNQIKVLGKSNVMVIRTEFPKTIKTNRHGDFGVRNLKVDLLLEGDRFEISD